LEQSKKLQLFLTHSLHGVLQQLPDMLKEDINDVFDFWVESVLGQVDVSNATYFGRIVSGGYGEFSALSTRSRIGVGSSGGILFPTRRFYDRPLQHAWALRSEEIKRLGSKPADCARTSSGGN